MSSWLPAAVLGYLLGSLPAAYLVVRWKSKMDIRKAGSGNVGTLNSYEVTRSKSVGIAVLLIDLLKGVAAVLVSRSVVGTDFANVAAAGVGAVLGHNFPVWLRFKGGRGLATSAGVMLVLGWVFVLLWGLLWGAGFSLARRVNVGNAIACVVTLLVVLLIPASVLQPMIPADAAVQDFRWFILLLMGVVLTKHVEPVKEYIAERKSRTS